MILEGNRSYFVTEDIDAERVGELVNACGYNTKSIAGKKLVITIEEI